MRWPVSDRLELERAERNRAQNPAGAAAIPLGSPPAGGGEGARAEPPAKWVGPKRAPGAKAAPVERRPFSRQDVEDRIVKASEAFGDVGAHRDAEFERASAGRGDLTFYGKLPGEVEGLSRAGPWRR